MLQHVRVIKLNISLCYVSDIYQSEKRLDRQCQVGDDSSGVKLQNPVILPIIMNDCCFDVIVEWLQV